MAKGPQGILVNRSSLQILTKDGRLAEHNRPGGFLVIIGLFDNFKTLGKDLGRKRGRSLMLHAPMQQQHRSIDSAACGIVGLRVCLPYLLLYAPRPPPNLAFHPRVKCS
eukprot:362077-Chlamydomonas_euryale.AAC.3